MVPQSKKEPKGLIYIQNRNTLAASHAVLAPQKLTNSWERKADAPSRENGKLWGTVKVKTSEK